MKTKSSEQATVHSTTPPHTQHLAKLLKWTFCQALGHDISYIVSSWYMTDIDFLRGHPLSCEMIAHVNMFRTIVVLGISRQIN